MTQQELQQRIAELEEQAIMEHDQAWFDVQVAALYARIAQEKKAERAKRDQVFSLCRKHITDASIPGAHAARMTIIRRRDRVHSNKETIDQALQIVRWHFEKRLQKAIEFANNKYVLANSNLEKEAHYTAIEVFDELQALTSVGYHDNTWGAESGYTAHGYQSYGGSSRNLMPKTDNFRILQQQAAQFNHEAITFVQEMQLLINN